MKTGLCWSASRTPFVALAVFSMGLIGWGGVVDSSTAGDFPRFSTTVGGTFDVPFSGLTKKPKVYVLSGGKTRAVKVLNVGESVVACAWTQKLPPGTYVLKLQSKEKGAKVEPVEVGTLVVEPPAINGAVLASGGRIVNISGKFFGTCPKVAMRQSGKSYNCKVDKKALPYADYQGRAHKSAMETFSGVSQLSFSVPKQIDATALAVITVTAQGVDADNFEFNGVHAVSGNVSGDVLSGVTVTLSGVASASTNTDSEGGYRFADLRDGTYTVAPSLDGYSFTPVSQSVTVSGGDVSGVDFSATENTYRIGGTISGDVKAGVKVTLAPDGLATTANAEGKYEFSNIRKGAYTLTPFMAGYSFSPASQAIVVELADVSGVNFVATENTYSVSGMVAGDILEGIAVALAPAGLSVTTDATGNYSFSGVTNGNYTVTPALKGYRFSPLSRSVTIDYANVTAVDFAATLNHSPVAQDIQGVTFADIPYAVSPLSACYDIDSEILFLVGVDSPVNGSVAVDSEFVVVFTPNTGFTGAGSFVYTVADTNGATDTATCEIQVVSDTLGASGTVGPEGGVVSGGGMKVDVPAGATSASATITISQGETEDGEIFYRIASDTSIDTEVAVTLPDPETEVASHDLPMTNCKTTTTGHWGYGILEGTLRYANFLTYSYYGLELVNARSELTIVSVLGAGLDATLFPYDGGLTVTKKLASVMYCSHSLEQLKSRKPTPIVLVHGYRLDCSFDGKIGGGDDIWGDLGSMLHGQFQNAAVCDFCWNTNACFEDVANDLRLAIDILHDATGKDVHIVGHSMGGVLARVYIQGLAQGRNGKELTYTPHVASLVTVGAPNSGIGPTANSCPYLLGFPKGQDDWTWYQKFAPQISAYQCGQHWSKPPSSLMPALYGSTFLGGYIPYKLSKTESLVADLPALALYGLTTQRGDNGTADLDGGDYLISFQGQRFRPEYKSGDFKLEASVDEYRLTECVLGNDWGETTLPGEANPWPESGPYFYGYNHTWGSHYQDFNSTPEVPVWAGQTEWHATWLNLKKWLTERGLIPIPTLTGACIVVDLESGDIQELDDPPSDLLTDDVYKATKMVLMRIPAGTFTMGSPEEELGRYDDETQHQVILTKDFYIGVFEVTQKQYETVMGTNPSSYQGDYRPVESVSWNIVRGGTWPGDPAGSGEPDATSFVGKMRERTGIAFDLPTEAQWEYACRAGTTAALNSGKNLESLPGVDPNMDEVGRYIFDGNDGLGGSSYSQKHTTVGSYLPNSWRLFDMHGNVIEYCLDWYVAEYSGTETDAFGGATGSYRVMRGGSWNRSARECRSAYRACIPSLA